MPEIALLMSTYQRPRHLRLALESIARQKNVAGRFELVVTDDGSTDETPQIVQEFARQVDFKVGFTTHPHSTFQLARCRNEGVCASQAPYLLFLDGDCVLPHNHVSIHLARRKVGVVMAGDCCRLNELTSARVTSEAISRGDFVAWGDEAELRRLQRVDRSSRFYRLIRHPTKPKLIGNNVGIWRSDFERINGYDENYQGWGCEDDDLRHRLRKAGVRIESILRWTHTFHLWHPVDVTAPALWKQGANVSYYLRRGRLTRCRNGLVKRRFDDIQVRVVGSPSQRERAESLVHRGFSGEWGTTKAEVEILFLPGAGDFSGLADCNILVALESDATARRRARRADVVVAPADARIGDHPLRFRLEDFDRALAAVA